MALKVIGAGFGRTGTLSLKQALETLGYRKTHHMEEVLLSARQVSYWHDVGAGKPVDWDAVFEGFEASVDFPSSAYYRELLAHFPEAKVVLTHREFESWYTSANATIYAVGHAMPRWLKWLVPQARKGFEMADACVWQRVFRGRFADKEHTRKVYQGHLEAVQAHVPADQLLVYQVKEGWEPLCTFLGVSVPAEEFPHVNDTAAFLRRVRVLRLLGWLPALLGVGLVALLLW